MKPTDIENLANEIISSHDITLKENEEKKKEIRNQIEKKTIQLFDHLFSNQVTLIEENDEIEKNLTLKSNELINNLKQLIQRQTTKTKTETEIEQVIEKINEIKQKLNNLHFNYYFETNETLENDLNIGKLVIVYIIRRIKPNICI